MSLTSLGKEQNMYLLQVILKSATKIRKKNFSHNHTISKKKLIVGVVYKVFKAQNSKKTKT